MITTITWVTKEGQKEIGNAPDRYEFQQWKGRTKNGKDLFYTGGDKTVLWIWVCETGDEKIGYVANSPYTVLGESMSAGRLYDKIGDCAKGKVILVTQAGALCKLCKKSIAGQDVLEEENPEQEGFSEP